VFPQNVLKGSNWVKLQADKKQYHLSCKG